MRSVVQIPRNTSLSWWRMSHSKKDFAISLLPWWTRCTSTFRKCWMVVPSDPPSHDGVMLWCWWERRMGCSGSESTSAAWMPEPRRMPIPCPVCRRPWRAWSAPDTFLVWTWRVGSGRLRWPRSPGSTLPLRWVAWAFTSFCACPMACVMLQQHFSASCRTAWGSWTSCMPWYTGDDVIVYSKTEEEHLVRLRTILERFMQHGLNLKPSKCNFFQTEISYLGHKVSVAGMEPGTKGLKGIAEIAPPPHTPRCASS